MIQAYRFFKARGFQRDLDQMYYICTAITVFIAILITVSFISITRLLIFHIKIATMNMTTVEYLNMSMRNDYNKSSIFDSEDDDYYDDSDLSDGNYTAVHKRSLYSHPQWAGFRFYRKVTHKFRRAWILIARTFLPNYKYQRLTNSRRTCNICFFSFKKPQILPISTRSESTNRSNRDSSRYKHRDNVNMDEFFATKTIRPVITLDEDGFESSGPDYDDTMGLDFSVLDGFSDVEEESRKKKITQNRTNKAAKLLDLSEDTLNQIHLQQQQQNRTRPQEKLSLEEETLMHEL